MLNLSKVLLYHTKTCESLVISKNIRPEWSQSFRNQKSKSQNLKFKVQKEKREFF